MAEYVEVLHRNNTRRPYNDMLLMHSPRIEESQIFMEHAITPSSLCKGMEEPSRAGVPSEVDYEDVFGGPPRFAALMSTPHLDSTPMAMLERAPARQFSLRTSSLPVFDLPVFGENAFSTTVHEGRSKSDAYDDMLDEEGHMLESFSPFNLPGASRSKASSFSTSQRMSPIHPTVAVAIQRGGDGATNLGPNLRTRHSNRPGAVKLSRRGSLSSASSFDESSGKLGDGYFTSLRNDTFISSVPSSPPQSSSCNHLKSTFGTNGSVGVGELMASAEVDDVFGGFPKRIYPQRLSQDSRTATNATETYNTKALEKAGLKDISDESRVCSSSSAAHASETSDTKKHIFSRSSSVNNGTDDRDQHEKEVMVDRQMDSSVLETSQTLVGKDANKYGGMHLTFQASFQLPTPRPPPILNTELKFKSWKDLASDVPVSHSHTSSMTVPSMVTPKNDVSEPFARQQSDKSLSVRQNTENLSHFSAVGHKGKVKPAEYTIDSEERELQASLANAWNIRQIERENHNAKFREEAPKILEVKDWETHREEQRQHSGGQLESSNIKQCDSMDLDNRENDANWKEWRKYSRRYRKEQSRAAALDGSLPKKDFDFEKQVPAPDRTRSLAEISVSRGAAKSPNIEEPLRSASEELLMERVLVSFEASSDPLASLDSQKKAIKGVSGTSEYLINEQALGRSGDVERVASLHGFMSGPSQDFVYIDEKNHLPLCIPVEDAECLIDLASCLDGFQELEEETCERSNSRWEQHMLARERGAKALEEMQHRHAKLLHQQEEKQQSPEILDGKVKRWAAGKEGNLRALLSNLQHVLWAECGWQPIPLTDLIEVPDVKKAYRKATLFVHPDKVQQKGASIQQKYIAERVFDILQEAWKTFNMQESF